VRRHLHILLVAAERAWAQANALKQEAEAEGDGAPQPAKRRRGLRRLRKAASWAGQLARVAGVVCDARGALESEAYAAWMQGNALMEGETQWEGAAAQFSRARCVCDGWCVWTDVEGPVVERGEGCQQRYQQLP
jgi:hypothetical protein